MNKFCLINLSFILIGLFGGYLYVTTIQYEIIGLIALIGGLSASVLHLGREFKLGFDELKMEQNK